jgi:hypothetical protein
MPRTRSSRTATRTTATTTITEACGGLGRTRHERSAVHFGAADHRTRRTIQRTTSIGIRGCTKVPANCMPHLCMTRIEA